MVMVSDILQKRNSLPIFGTAKIDGLLETLLTNYHLLNLIK